MRVPGLSVDEVDRLSDEFGALVEREMQSAVNLAARQLGDRLAARANTAAVSQGDVNIIFRLWDTVVDEKLLPALEDIWLHAANHQRQEIEDILPLLAVEQISAAVSMPDASDDPGATSPPPPPTPPPIFVKGSEAALSFLSNSKNQLRNIGNETWSSARIGLSEGMAKGESIPKLAKRVQESTGVSRARATMIARTEVIGASNAGSIFAMRSTNGLVTRKTWLATFDGRTRPDHMTANGQTVDLAAKFTVGTAKMDHPGDPYGPPEQVINCRCSMTYEVTMPPLDQSGFTAAAVSETTGMIALRPADADEFTVDGGDPADELHVTVTFLGEVTDDLHEAAKKAAQKVAEAGTPITARVAGYGVLGEEDAVVLFLNGDGFAEIKAALDEESLAAPEQWAPWICHMTLGYGIDVALGEQFMGREFIIDALSVDVGESHERFVLGNGAVTVRAGASPEVFQDDCPEGQHRMPDGSCMPDEDMDGRLAKWRGVMVVEDIPTGDGRQFAADALTWPDLPLPLQWQKETTHGGMNDVVVTVGTIEAIERNGNEIVGEGLIDLGSEDGREVYRRIDELGLGGVSIVADDPEQADVEYVYPDGCAEIDDKTPDEIEAEVPLEDLEKCFMPILMIFHSGRIRALTVVDTPAFVEAKIEIVEEAEVTAAVALPVVLTVGNETYEVGEIETLTDLPAFLEHLLNVAFTPVASHETGTSDDPWDASENEGRLGSPMSTSTGEKFYAWIDRDAVEDGEMPKSAGKFPHHNVSTDGAPGAANLAGCRAGIGALNGARGGSSIPSDDREGVYNHLARHIRDAGEDPPELRDADDLEEAEVEIPQELIAAAYTVTIPDVPPLEWYTEPTELPTIGAIKVTPEGRFYGLLGPSGVAHRAFKNKRIEIPKGNVDYSRFMSRTAMVTMADNTVEEIPAGVVTMNCGHANAVPSVSANQALEHYDNSCSIVATIRIGENSKGVWVAGALMPGIEATDLARLLGCQLSGDWRPHQEKPGMRELTAALLVPVPGFASAGPTVRIENGELVAATAPVHFEGEVEVTAAAATAVDDVNIKTFSTKDAEDDQADAGQPEGETETETTVEVTTETEIVAELVIDDEVLDDDETALDTDAIHDGYVDDLPDFEEVLRANDPKVLAAEIAAELRKDRLAELVASVRSDD